MGAPWGPRGSPGTPGDLLQSLPVLPRIPLATILRPRGVKNSRCESDSVRGSLRRCLLNDFRTVFEWFRLDFWIDFRGFSARVDDSSCGSLGQRFRVLFRSTFALRAKSPTCVSHRKNRCELKVGPSQRDSTHGVEITRTSIQKSSRNRSKIVRKSFRRHLRSEPRTDSLSQRAFFTQRSPKIVAKGIRGRTGGD